MARKIIDIGTIGNDGTGDSIRDSFRKVNDNFRELYSSLGLGERLTFIGLDDTPISYAGTVDEFNNTPVLTVSDDASGIKFKKIVSGVGIGLEFPRDRDEIIINSEFASISADREPKLGGDLSVKSGGETYKIIDLALPTENTEAASKAYADTKVGRAGINTIDTDGVTPRPEFGRMTGPLILARDPQPDDDELYDGLVAATKRYVDNASFGSISNLFVALSGSDERPGVSPALQGRALAYAYRTLEAACKRAEEILLESRVEIGPYKKTLTYNNGANICALDLIGTAPAPASGSGFSGEALLSVDTAVINTPGVNFYVGDIITLQGGTLAPGAQAASFEVLTVGTVPGPILSFKILSSGLYTIPPTAVGVASTVPGNPLAGGATFDVTFKVSGVNILNNGSGYSLVSVRIVGGGGTGAFGTATVTGGSIASITIDDQGSGFTTAPTVIADLPRFFIRTEGQRTDYSGDYSTNTPEAFRGRDIREGLYLRGEESGALAQILSHTGELDSSGREIFDVDIKYGVFQLGEPISYGDVTKNAQITIIVESGVYEENLPIKVPQNVAIVGDEFRRVIVRPRKGTSSSPWAFGKFRRDVNVDGLAVADKPFGYHYLHDSSKPVYLPKLNNPGNYKLAARLLQLNRNFLQDEVIGWIANQISTNSSPFSSSFVYDDDICKRDVGLIVDSLVFDLKYGEYNRTISAGLKYYQNASGLLAIGSQLSQTLAAITRLNFLIDRVLTNTAITPTYGEVYNQTIDTAIISEAGAVTIVNGLITALKDVMSESGGISGVVNFPKENDQMDVFLCNDATILRAMTGQGHGGFMMVLDPQGQILAKSPYAQECASFSKSIDAQTFAGGMFVDGFAGNLQFTHESTVPGSDNKRIAIAGLDRFPQLPASFIVDDEVFRVNYVRDFVYNPNGSTATFVLDDPTPFTRTAGKINCTISVGSPAIITSTDHRLQAGATVVFSVNGAGSLPSGITAGEEYYVLPANLTNNTFRITASAGSLTAVNTTSAGSGVFQYQRTYELLMPGNRSMLCNDYTQINDLGYGIIAVNGGLVEAVSMFTYYCHISYYSLRGGQIRSVGGSSAHGNYALVAEGSDPLEVPTPTGVYFEMQQKVVCYAPFGYANTTGGLFVYVDGFNYTPTSGSELEVDHGYRIYRYPITSVAVEGLPAGVVRLNLTSAEGASADGLFASIADNTVMTLRQLSKLILTGDLVDVAVRPSTGLVLNDLPDVYRVLQFEEYVDPLGPYEISITNSVSTGQPAEIAFLLTITDIDSGGEICTTSVKHNLQEGDKFIPNVTSNGFTSGTTYYVIDTPQYNQLKLSTSPGGSAEVFAPTGSVTITGVRSHKYIENYTFTLLNVGGALPGNTNDIQKYYVISNGLTDTKFRFSETRNGTAVNTSNAGTGTQQLIPEGLTRTSLRENYNYLDLSIHQSGEFVSGSTKTCTISFANPAVVTCAGHGFSIGDVIRFSSTGNLPEPLTADSRFYHIISDGFGINSFQISSLPNGLVGRLPIETTSAGSGTHTVGLVKGRVGDSSFAVVGVAPNEEGRIVGSKLMWQGVEYTITQYDNFSATGEIYARITLDKVLQHSVLQYEGTVSLKGAVAARSLAAQGDLTIRISLTRVTSHDLLEIGTGSYADTNYPNEIYGPSVNSINEANETEERDVGRVFYVTTDQFGNFSVGPYFRVDQGTGTVTFSAAIALSNLDGLGFKRGVPVSEFSVDATFSDNATDTVPTENATRAYIDRRLGISHEGNVVEAATRIPNASGFISINGELAMQTDLDLGNNKVSNLADPISPQDAVNLRSLTFANLQEFSVNNIDAGDTIVFTGDGNNAVNASIIGDVTFELRTGLDSSLNRVDVQIVPGAIVDADVNSAAGIAQSKLVLNLATAAAAAPTGTAQAKQAASGLSSFDTSQFTVTDGFVTLKSSGILLSRLEDVAADSVIGNSTASPAAPTNVPFATVVNEGGAIKKSQYTSQGVLRRTGSGSVADGDYTLTPVSSLWTGSEQNQIVIRNSTGDIGANVGEFNQIKVDSYLALDGSTSGLTGRYLQIYTPNANGGILLGHGTTADDRKNQYRNNLHEFQPQDGIGYAPIRASQVRCIDITTGGTTDTGTVTGYWSLSAGSRFQATYSADVAEFYEGDKEYEVGTVLVFGGDKEITTTNIRGDTRVAGVVSDNAAFVMYDACPGLKNLIALVGRVPCKVVGKIKKGDLLITSGIAGVAVAASGNVSVGTLVGKALENYDSDHIGTIEIAVGRS